MKNKFYILLFGINMLGFYPFVFGQTESTYNTFSQGFKNPPISAQPIVFHWWLGSKVDTLRLREELKSLKDAGIAGVTIFEIGVRQTGIVETGPAFLSDESLKSIKFTVEEAEKLEMEVGLNTASSWNAGGNWIQLPLSLAPHESILVVFRSGESKSHFGILKNSKGGYTLPRFCYSPDGINILDDGEYELITEDDTVLVNNYVDAEPLEGAWEVFFPEGWGAPERVIFGELKSWTESDHNGVKYFSGNARYEKSFVHVPNTNAWPEALFLLDLGDLSHVAEVWLNDKRLGITWSKPHRFDVTDYLQPGNNTLKIEVANTWSNRLVGDTVMNENYTNTNISSTVVSKGFFIRASWKEVPLIESGLFGPVQIVKARTLKITENFKSEISIN